MDVLSDVLGVVRLSGAVFFTAEFSAPWALESPSEDLLAGIVMPRGECVSLFHIVVDGGCIIEGGRQAPVSLEAGDIVVFPHGQSHTMRSRDAAAVTRLGHVLSRQAGAVPHVVLGGGGPKTHFICGYLSCDQRFASLFGALPPMLLVRRRTGYRTLAAVEGPERQAAIVPHESAAWLATTLSFTISEAMAARPGNTAMLGRLAELMFVEIIREYMRQLPEGECGWLAGLKDPHVGRALHLLHAEPMRNWTVDELAHEVAVSRSAFAQRFTRLVGEAPIRYLASWRMQLAKQMLRETPASTIQSVASRVGYDSEPAFNRAFKRATGSPPATWRRDARPDDGGSPGRGVSKG
jgi:AraC-like DNA-binding protein